MLTALALTFTCMAACNDDPITYLDRATDCADICDKYKECFDESYDTEACRDDCNDMVDESKTARIDDCQECIEGASCTGATFSCTDNCIGIVP
ncbi:MAG: hypothetical protein ABW321_10960 [Polyangiales bacterium]